MIRHLTKRFRRAQGGATAVEFAMIAPVFFMLVFGLFEFGRVLYIQHNLSIAASRAVRMVYVDPTLTEADVQTHARGFAHRVDAEGLTVTMSTQSYKGVVYTELDLALPHEIVLPFIGSYDLVLDGSARLPAVSTWAD